MKQVESIEFPMMVVNVRVVGHNSLVGALATKFIEAGYIEHIGRLNPTEIVFKIHTVVSEVNLYEEINKVRDFLKIDEKKITVFIE